MDRSRRGSLTTPASPSRGRIRLVLRGNTAACSASRANCQVAVSLSIANHHASLPVAYRLYLPEEEWAAYLYGGRRRGLRRRSHSRRKAEIAVAQLRFACAASCRVVLSWRISFYGRSAALRAETTGLGLKYAVGIPSTLTVKAPGPETIPAEAWAAIDAPAKRQRGAYGTLAPGASVGEIGPSPYRSELGAGSLGGRAAMPSCPRALPACVFALGSATRREPPLDKKMAADRVAQG